MGKRLKAYKVDSGNDEGHSAIVFATNNASARRKGANEFDMCLKRLSAAVERLSSMSTPARVKFRRSF